MNDYEKSFVTRMGRLTNAGIDFEDLAREALERRFGGTTEVLLRGFSTDALRELKQFANELSRIFGGGAMGFYEPIIRYADLGLYGSKRGSPLLEMLRQLGPAQSGVSSTKGIILHDHRIKDEAGNYPDTTD